MSDSDKDIINEYNDTYNEGNRDWSVYVEEAYKDLGVYLGNQWSDKDKEFLKDENRNAYVYNNTKRFIKQVSGYQRKNRLSSVTDPIEGSDQSISDILSDVLLYVMQYENGYQVLSDSFEYGSCVTGINLVSLWMDYSADRINGDIKISREPFNSFLIDPYFTKQDLSDCRYLLRRRYLSEEEVIKLLPNRAKEIKDLRLSGIRDGKFTRMPQSMKARQGDLYRYDEYWKRVNRPAKLLVDRTSGETKVFRGKTVGLRAFKEQYPFVDVLDITEPGVELNIIVEDELMYSGKDPYGLDDYPFVPVVGFYTPEYDRFEYKLQGIVRTLRDAQEEYNKIRSKTTDVIQSSPNSGWIVKEDSVKNKKDLFKTGQGVVIERTLNSMPEDVQKIPPPQLSQGIPVLLELLSKDLIQLGGGSEELLGVAEGGNTEVSGVLAKQRAANALTTLQDLFDNLSLSQKIMGGKILKMVQSNWSQEKIQRIVGKEVPDISDVDITKFDVVVKEAMLTDTQRNLQYVQLLQARQADIPIPNKAIINAMPIADKTELLEEYEAEAKQMQEQAAKQAEMENLQKRLINAETIHRLSLASQQRKRGIADLALSRERLSEVSENRANAILDLVKAATEVQGLKQEQIIQAVTFLKGLQDTDAEEAKDDIALASLISDAAVQEQSTQTGSIDPQNGGQNEALGLGQI